MPANVITLSVLNGSGGYSIAHHVADRMGLRYYDWEITSEAANRAGVAPSDVIASERVPGFFERMMARLGAVSAMTVEGGTGFADPSPAVWDTALQSFTSDAYRQVIEQVVHELAHQGNAVIVGHAGQHVLREHPDVLRVFVTALSASPSSRASISSRPKRSSRSPTRTAATSSSASTTSTGSTPPTTTSPSTPTASPSNSPPTP